MKKIIIVAMASVLTVLVQAREANWGALYTGKAVGDMKPGLSAVDDYSAFYCTAAVAQTLFGSIEVSGIETYLVSNFDAGKDGLKASGTALLEGNYGTTDQQYGFTKYDGGAVAADDYIGIVFFEGDESREFRVFGTGSATLVDGLLVFDDTVKTAYIGSWTPTPEPTGTMLILFAMALLALRRAQNKALADD